MKYFQILLSLILVSNFSEAQIFYGEYGAFSAERTKKFYLQENLEFFDYPNGLFYTGKHVYVGTNMPPMVVKYDTSGQQLHIVASKGRGPAEFLQPSLIARKGDNFLVYDAMQLKFTEFTSEGEALDEYTGVKFTVGNYKYLENNIVTYNVGKSNEPLVRVLEIQGNKLVEGNSYDKLTDLQLKLSRLSGLAPLATKGDMLYYGHIDEPRIFWINLKTGKKGNKKFKDDLFSIEKQNFSINDRAPKADEEWVNFIFTNSSMSKIIPLDDFLLVETNHGSMFNRTRTTVLHVFDYKLKKLDEIHLTHPQLLAYGSEVKANWGNEIMFIQNFADATTKSGKYESGLEYRQQEGSGRKVTIFEIKKAR